MDDLLAVADGQPTLTCGDSGDGGNVNGCTVAAVADIAPEDGAERVLVCNEYPGFNGESGAGVLVLVSGDLRPLWTYHGAIGVTARAVDVVPGDGRPELLVEDGSICPMESCDGWEPFWRVLRWRDGTLVPVFETVAGQVSEVAYELRPEEGAAMLARAVATRHRPGPATRNVWNEAAGRFERSTTSQP